MPPRRRTNYREGGASSEKWSKGKLAEHKYADVHKDDFKDMPGAGDDPKAGAKAAQAEADYDPAEALKNKFTKALRELIDGNLPDGVGKLEGEMKRRGVIAEDRSLKAFLKSHGLDIEVGERVVASIQATMDVGIMKMKKWSTVGFAKLMSSGLAKAGIKIGAGVLGKFIGVASTAYFITSAGFTEIQRESEDGGGAFQAWRPLSEDDKRDKLLEDGVHEGINFANMAYDNDHTGTLPEYKRDAGEDGKMSFLKGDTSGASKAKPTDRDAFSGKGWRHMGTTKVPVPIAETVQEIGLSAVTQNTQMGENLDYVKDVAGQYKDDALYLAGQADDATGGHLGLREKGEEAIDATTTDAKKAVHGAIDKATGDEMSYSMWYNESTGKLQVSFKGSSTKSEWLNNFASVQGTNFNDENGKSMGRVGSGFYRMYLAMRDGIQKQFTDLQAELAAKGQSVQSLAFSGHSLGGVFATFSTADLGHNLNIDLPGGTYKGNVSVVTWGASMAGTATFGDAVRANTDSYTRVLSRRDPAPKMGGVVNAFNESLDKTTSGLYSSGQAVMSGKKLDADGVFYHIGQPVFIDPPGDTSTSFQTHTRGFGMAAISKLTDPDGDGKFSYAEVNLTSPYKEEIMYGPLGEKYTASQEDRDDMGRAIWEHPEGDMLSLEDDDPQFVVYYGEDEAPELVGRGFHRTYSDDEDADDNLNYKDSKGFIPPPDDAKDLGPFPDKPDDAKDLGPFPDKPDGPIGGRQSLEPGGPGGFNPTSTIDPNPQTHVTSSRRPITTFRGGLDGVKDEEHTQALSSKRRKMSVLEIPFGRDPDEYASSGDAMGMVPFHKPYVRTAGTGGCFSKRWCPVAQTVPVNYRGR